LKSRYKSDESKQGLTLLELLIVLTIIGIGSAIVGVAIYRGLGDIRLKNTAREAASSLRYARSMAVAEKRTYIFILDPEKRYYYVSAWSPPESTSPQSSTLKVEGAMVKTFPEGINGVDKEIVYIIFYPLGSSTGGRFSIMNEEGSTSTIQVEPLTGRVNIIR